MLVPPCNDRSVISTDLSIQGADDQNMQHLPYERNALYCKTPKLTETSNEQTSSYPKLDHIG